MGQRFSPRTWPLSTSISLNSRAPPGQRVPSSILVMWVPSPSVTPNRRWMLSQFRSEGAAEDDDGSRADGDAPASRLRAGEGGVVGSKVSSSPSQIGRGGWRNGELDGSHQALIRQEVVVHERVPVGARSGSSAPSRYKAMLRALGSAQSAGVMGAPEGVNQRSSVTSVPAGTGAGGRRDGPVAARSVAW